MRIEYSGDYVVIDGKKYKLSGNIIKGTVRIGLRTYFIRNGLLYDKDGISVYAISLLGVRSKTITRSTSYREFSKIAGKLLDNIIELKRASVSKTKVTYFAEYKGKPVRIYMNDWDFYIDCRWDNIYANIHMYDEEMIKVRMTLGPFEIGGYFDQPEKVILYNDYTTSTYTLDEIFEKLYVLETSKWPGTNEPIILENEFQPKSNKILAGSYKEVGDYYGSKIVATKNGLYMISSSNRIIATLFSIPIKITQARAKNRDIKIVINNTTIDLFLKDPISYMFNAIEYAKDLANNEDVINEFNVVY